MMKTVTAASEAEADKDKDATRPKPHDSKLLFDSQFIDSVKETLEN